MKQARLHPWLSPLADELARHGNEHIAHGQEAYMRERFRYFGVKTPERRVILKEHLSACGQPDIADIPVVVRSCWGQPQREMHYCGMELLTARSRELDMSHLSLLEELILQNSWWDTVDHLAVHGVGALLLRHRDHVFHANERWMNSGELWLLRTALIFQLAWKERTDTDLLFSNCKRLSGNKEFFIRKGIGWALRQCARTDPERVRGFVKAAVLSPLSEREALRRIGSR